MCTGQWIFWMFVTWTQILFPPSDQLSISISADLFFASESTLAVKKV